MTSAVEDLTRAAVGFGVTSAELRASLVVRESVASTAGVAQPLQDHWRGVVERLDRVHEREAASHHGKAGPARCTGCDAPVRWVTTEAGKAMSLDPLPRPNGSIILVHQGQSRLVAQVVPRVALPVVGRPAYQSHFASCPMSDQFRKRRRARPEAAGVEVAAGERLVPCRVCGLRMHPYLLAIVPTPTAHPTCEEKP